MGSSVPRGRGLLSPGGSLRSRGARRGRTEPYFMAQVTVGVRRKGPSVLVERMYGGVDAPLERTQVGLLQQAQEQIQVPPLTLPPPHHHPLWGEVPSPGESLFFFLKIVCIYLKGTLFQMTVTARAQPGLSQEVSPVQVAVSAPSPAAFPGLSARSWIGSGGAETPRWCNPPQEGLFFCRRMLDSSGLPRESSRQGIRNTGCVCWVLGRS